MCLAGFAMTPCQNISQTGGLDSKKALTCVTCPETNLPTSLPRNISTRRLWNLRISVGRAQGKRIRYSCWKQLLLPLQDQRMEAVLVATDLDFDGADHLMSLDAKQLTLPGRLPLVSVTACAPLFIFNEGVADQRSCKLT